jgi:hypothetical protein
MTIAVTFSTLAGRKTLLLTKEEALKCEVGEQVRHVLKLAEEGACGAEFNLPFYGRVNIEVVGKE